MTGPGASFRDPVHGLVRADSLETALINSRPLQRLRRIRQLGATYLVFPAAEHSRFSHALGAMHLAGRVYDAMAPRSDGLLDPDPRSVERRLVRAAALLHDVGHPPFSHVAEELFEDGIGHEEMSRRLLAVPEVERAFSDLGEGVTADDVRRLLEGRSDPLGRLLSQIVAGELDVDKMDYLLRDSLFCGVRYGSYDLERLLDTIVPIRDPDTGAWGLGVEEGGVHALEALVMARYYMFTQVYFNVVGKAFELHLTRWLADESVRWPGDPERFLTRDDITVATRMRASLNPHARAVMERRHWELAHETDEHLSPAEKARFESVLPELEKRFGPDRLMVSYSAKDPHRMGSARVFVERHDGRPVPMERASHFIAHLARIERYRLYTPAELTADVSRAVRSRLSAS
ncbi:MAG: HD domain-containing protein [Thermoanaerobaculia bacterium]